LISEVVCQNFKGIKIENQIVSIITIPDIGGKIISIRDKKNDFEFVFDKSNDGLKISNYGSNFDIESPAGIDECFPTVGKCRYPEYPWEGTVIPDHGEIWPLKFKTSIMGSCSIRQEVNGIRFPYLFKRKIRLIRNMIIFSYQLISLCSMDFKYGWSMHPQFVIREDSIIEVKNHPDFYVDFSTKYNFNSNDKKYQWPYATGKENNKIDFSKVINIGDGSLTKLYLSGIQDNMVSLFYKKEKQKLGVKLDSGNSSICGIALNKGGWPFNGKPYKWIGIEPCNCITDKLSDSVERGFFGLLKHKSIRNWEVSFVIN